MATSKQFNAEQGISVGQEVSVLDSSGNITTQTISGRNTNADVAITPAGSGSVTVPSINKVAITAPASSATLTIANGKTLTASNTLTFSGTDSSNVVFGSGGTVAYTGVATLSSLSSVGTITSGTWSATPVALAYGGTGANLTGPGADRIFFWDESAASSAWLQLGNSLSITGTSLDAVQDIRTSASPTFSGLTVNGNLTVTGTSTILNTTQLSVDDINITLGDTASPTDASATGGGITLKGSTDKTIIWDNPNTNWTSSEHWNLASGKQYKINNVQISAANLSNGTTGSNAVVLATSPTLATPILGVATATTINKVAFTAPATGSTLTIADGKTLTISNTLGLSGTDSANVVFGAGGTVAYAGNKLSVFAATTSDELRGVISNETGIGGSLVFANTPTLTTPNIGEATGISLTTSGTNAAPALSLYNTNNENIAGVRAMLNSVTLVGGASTTGMYGISNQCTYAPASASITNVWHDLNLATINNGSSYSNISASYERMDLTSAALGGTITNYYGVQVATPTINAAATTNIGSYYGILVSNPLNGTSQSISNIYGITSQVNTGTGTRYNLYISGSATNYIASPVNIGDDPSRVITAGQDWLTVADTNSAGVVRAQVINRSATSGSQARYDLSTGSANAYAIWDITESGAPASTLALGPGLTGGLIIATGLTSAPILLKQSTTERMRIDSSGNILIGATTQNAQLTPKFQITGDGGAAHTLVQRSNTSANPIVEYKAKSNGTVASPLVVTSGDGVWRLDARGYDGDEYLQLAGIDIAVDGGAGNGDMPGRIVFSTTADAASAPTERMRIDSSGNVGIGATATKKLDIFNSGTTTTDFVIRNGTVSLLSFVDGGAGYAGTTTNHPLLFTTNNTEKMRISATGEIGVGTTSLTAYNVRVGSNITGATTAYALSLDGVVQSGVTGTAIGFNTAIGTQAFTFTLSGLVHYRASQGTFGLNSTVSNQYGFIANSTLTGATNNYGVYSDLAAGDRRWNIWTNNANSNIQGNLLEKAPAPTTKAAVVTLTAAEILTKIVVTSGTTYAVTVPTGAQMEVAIVTWPTDGSVDWSVINTASGTITIQSGIGHTLVGTMTVLTGISATFRTRKTATDTYVTYRIA